MPLFGAVQKMIVGGGAGYACQSLKPLVMSTSNRERAEIMQFPRSIGAVLCQLKFQSVLPLLTKR